MHQLQNADHARHDLTLIAGHASADLADTDRRAADVQLSACESCAELRRDIVAIAAASRSLPAPARRIRDFRLDAAQAARLARGSWLRAFLRPFAATGTAVRPMAAAFTSLGIAGLFVAVLLPGLAGPAGAPTTGGDRELGLGQSSGAATFQAQAAPLASSELLPAGAEASERAGFHGMSAAPGTETTDVKVDDGASNPLVAVGGVATHVPEAPVDGSQARLAAPMISPIAAASLGLLVVGLLLFGLRFAGRRLR